MAEQQSDTSHPRIFNVLQVLDGGVADAQGRDHIAAPAPPQRVPVPDDSIQSKLDGFVLLGLAALLAASLDNQYQPSRGDAERAEKVYEKLTLLISEDVADAVLYCATRPAH